MSEREREIRIRLEYHNPKFNGVLIYLDDNGQLLDDLRDDIVNSHNEVGLSVWCVGEECADICAEEFGADIYKDNYVEYNNEKIYSLL